MREPRRTAVVAAKRIARAAIRRSDGRSAALALRVAGRIGAGDRVSAAVRAEARRRLQTGEARRAAPLLAAVVVHDPRATKRMIRLVERAVPQHARRTAADTFGRLAADSRLPSRRRLSFQVAYATELDRLGEHATAVRLLGEAEGALDDAARRRALLRAATNAGDADLVRSLLPPRLVPSTSPPAATLLVARGVVADDEERWQDAATAWADAIRCEPTVADWHHRLGRARQRIGDWPGARDAYETAVSLDSARLGWQRRLVRARKRSKAGLSFPTWSDDGALERNLATCEAGAVAPLGDEDVRGWVPADADADAPVRFRLNGELIADTTPATPVELADGNLYLEFRRSLRDLWDHLGEGDVLAVEHCGSALAMTDGSHEHVIADARASCSAALLSRLREGDVFNKYGRLRPSIQTDEQWQSGIMRLYGELREQLRERFGLELIPFYGTMLGAVREGNFLGHDNDFDTIYISQASSPDAVKREFRDICGFLIEQGHSLRVKNKHTWVRVPGTRHKLDIFFAWFDENDDFQVSYGHHGPEVKRSDAFWQLHPMRIGRYEIPVPANAEDLLTQLYGAGWRQPDPGFSHFSSTRVTHPEYWLTMSESTELYWREFYRDHHIDGCSPFARFVRDWLPPQRTVLDVGCGSGRDAVFFADQGYRVVAGDRAPEAVEQVRASHLDADHRDLQVQQVDACDPDDLRRMVAAAADGRGDSDDLVVYLRFFLHAIEERTETTLLDTLADCMPGGFHLCAEFRTEQDADRSKHYGGHYRRFIDESRFVERLRDRWGFEVEHLSAGTGFSPFDGEDPHLARIIARAPSA